MVVLSILLLFAVLLFPGHPNEFSLDALSRLPLEVPALVLLLLWLNRRYARWLSMALVIIIGVLLLLRLADIGSYLAFNRQFSPLLELHLVADGWNLASTAIGPGQAGAVILVALAVFLALCTLLYRCLLTISQVYGQPRKILLGVSIATLILGSAGLFVQQRNHLKGPVEAKTVPELAQRITAINKSIVDQRQFIADLQHDSVLDVSRPQFKALAGRDVILLFVESYGRGYIDAERFSVNAHERLQSVENTLVSAGLGMRSGWLTSPTRGGRSWLAHSTFQSGLEIDNQARFDRLVTTDRESLSTLFAQAGWETIGLMPAIQFDWPEGAWYGFQELRTSSQMRYAGKRFGYATMPDQYTLAHFENNYRQKNEQPIMATMALLSTHAPWTPIPIKIDWDKVGDGSVFDGTHRFGETISWKNRSKVQDMYAQTFDYTLDVIGEYAARYAQDAIIIVVGDHQPPPVINGWGKSADVPIHIITRDLELLDRLPSQYWKAGMVPDDSIESLPMSGIRKTLSNVFE